MPHIEPTLRSWVSWSWLLLGWLVSRAASLAVWLFVVPVMSGDVDYYFKHMHAHLALGVPAAATMPEYPTPVLWVLVLPYLLGAGTALGFKIAFVGLMLALDLFFTVLLRRGPSPSAAWYWVGFGLALGPIIYLRLDLLPALGAAGAIIALAAGRYRTSGVLLGLGAGLKVWPATVYPITFSGQRNRDHRITVSFFVTGVALVIAALVYGGWGRLISPLQWQSGRGLQIESAWATVPMVARLFSPGYSVSLSRWQAYEVFGPGVAGWLTFANVLGVLGYVAFVVGYVFWFRTAYPGAFARRPRLVENPSPITIELIAFAAVTLITITLITNKTFSPQYLTWLGAATAVFWLVAGPDSSLRWTTRITGVWVLVLAVATQVVYPIGYDALVRPSVWDPAVTTVLAVRNVLLIALGVWLLLQLALRRKTARAAITH